MHFRCKVTYDTQMHLKPALHRSSLNLDIRDYFTFLGALSMLQHILTCNNQNGLAPQIYFKLYQNWCQECSVEIKSQNFLMSWFIWVLLQHGCRNLSVSPSQWKYVGYIQNTHQNVSGENQNPLSDNWQIRGCKTVYYMRACLCAWKSSDRP